MGGEAGRQGHGFLVAGWLVDPVRCADGRDTLTPWRCFEGGQSA